MTRILVVEDEILVRELAIDDLSDAGFEVHGAASGDQALDVLNQGEKFDVLFTDLRMPGQVDGWQLGRLAPQLSPGIKVIYASGYSEQIQRLDEHERYLHKPYRFDEVLRTISCLVAPGAADGCQAG